MIQHIVNISGGKDSTACYLLALQRGVPFRAVMADTGNEHPITIEYAERLAERTGGPQAWVDRLIAALMRADAAALAVRMAAE